MLGIEMSKWFWKNNRLKETLSKMKNLEGKDANDAVKVATFDS